MKTALRTTVIIISCLVFAFSSVAVTNAATQADLERIQRELQEIRTRKAQINQAIQAEKNKQGSYNNELRGVTYEKNLVEQEKAELLKSIDYYKEQIQLLDNSILSTQEIIAKTKGEMTELEAKADVQLREMFLASKTNSTGLNLIFANGGTDFVKQGLYQKSIQDDTNSTLSQLESQNEKLRIDREKLEVDKVQVEADKHTLDQQAEALIAKEAELQSKIARLNALRVAAQANINNQSKLIESLQFEESKSLAEYELVQQQIFNQIRQISNGTYVKKGTIIGQQGLTGLTTGYHLHFGVQVNGSYQNPCAYIPAGRFSNCAGNGTLAWPFAGTFYYTSTYGYRNLGNGTSSFHAAIDIAHPNQNQAVMAAHDGWYIRGFEACNSANWLCKGGGANYVILCENKNNCNQGLKTMYWHLK